MWVYPIIKCTDVACNLKCDYCFYRYMDQGVKAASIMSEEVLISLTRELLEINSSRCEFLWHGGEALLAGIDFFRRAIELQREYNNRGTIITNSIQTNGTLINEEFANFFKENNFRVGISLDGPEHIHNYHRRSIRGRGSFAAVMNGMKLCQERGISTSVVSVVTAYSVKFSEKIYRFFLLSGIKSFSFNPAFEPDREGRLCDFSVQDADFADFMESIFELWFEDDDPEINIRQLTEPLRGMLGGELSACVYSGQCSRFLDIYPNGDVKPCHSFLGESMRLGNICVTPLTEIIANESYGEFQRYVQELPQECLDCRHFSVCHGGCTDHRNITVDGKHHEKYIYCGSRKRVFSLLEERFTELEDFRKEVAPSFDRDKELVQLTILPKERR
ncbi:MAG: radical SAM protein [Patescibacteria group bacterium]